MSQFISKLIIFDFLLLLVNCQLKIPFKSFPFLKYNGSSPSETMSFLINQTLYAHFEMGTPKQSVDLPLVFDSNDFYISNEPKFNSSRFSEMGIYNSSKSTTFNESQIYAYQGDIFIFGLYCKDLFFFDDKEYYIDFYSAYTYDEVYSGGIGLQLLPRDPYSIIDSTPDKERTFMERIKKNNLIKNYTFSIFYNTKENKKDDDGFILFGSLLHNVNSDLGYYKKGYFKEENITSINLINDKNKKTVIDMDGIIGYEGDNKSKIIEGFDKDYKLYLNIELNYNSGGIKIPNYFRQFYQKVFEEYINRKECFNDTFNWGAFSFYYCKNDKNILSKIKNVFPGIKFENKLSGYNFYLDFNDLFIVEKDYAICLIYFDTKDKGNKKWNMGKPFLKKYQFIINYDEKYLKFYKIFNENGENNTPSSKGVSYVVYIVSIISAVIVVSVIFIVIFKFYLYEKYFRKKRANELDDNDYEYMPKDQLQQDIN